MKLHTFPPGGRDLMGDKPRLVPAETVRSLLPAAAGDEELESKLNHALRTQTGGSCYIGLSTEIGLLKRAAGL